MFKNKIAADLSHNSSIEGMTDLLAKEAKISSEGAKLWRYYQRFHFHATGIGAMSLGLLIFLSFVQAPRQYKTVTGYLIGIGGFLYPFVWLFAAMSGGEMGRGAAKEAFEVFAYGGGLFLVGAFLTMALGLKYPIKHLCD